MLSEGELAPDFDLETDGGGRIRLKDLRGSAVVVYFYPKDDTSGCTKQAIGFTELAEDFAASGAKIIGISPDSVASHDKFKAKHSLTIQLASDPEKETCEAYNVWVEKSMYGRKYMGVERSTFLISPDGKLAKVWRKVKVPGHVEEVLKSIQSLTS